MIEEGISTETYLHGLSLMLDWATCFLYRQIPSGCPHWCPWMSWQKEPDRNRTKQGTPLLCKDKRTNQVKSLL